MSCSHRDDAGPWVLGALSDADAGAFAAHLERCADCRSQVEELQPVADVLPMAAPQLLPPPALKGRIMAVVESEAELLRAAGPEADRPPAPAHAAPAPRRRRWSWAALRPLPAAALASVLLAVGVAGGVLLSGGDDGAQTHRGFGPRGAQVALRVDDDRGALELRGMPAPPRGRVYQVWIIRGDEAPIPTHALFTVARDGRAQVDIAESLDGADRVLITDEPPRGSDAPTSQPIAGADLT
jgi:hypothetical protein